MPKILIVEDEPSAQELLVTYLEPRGFQTCVAPTIQKAIEIARTTRPATGVDEAEMVRLMCGRQIAASFLLPVATNAPPALEVEHLSLRDANRPSGYRLQDISFTVRRGEIVGHRHAGTHSGVVQGPHDQLSACPVAAGPINFACQQAFTSAGIEQPELQTARPGVKREDTHQALYYLPSRLRASSISSCSKALA